MIGVKKMDIPMETQTQITHSHQVSRKNTENLFMLCTTYLRGTEGTLCVKDFVRRERWEISTGPRLTILA